MRDEELLKLYAADQAERRKFSLLQDEAQKAKMRETIQANDVKRRELVLDLVPSLHDKRLSAEDCYYAATIYSRGESLTERNLAFEYAKKAYSLVRFKKDDFSEKVKSLYDDTSKKLKDENPLNQQKNTPLQLQPAFQSAQKKKEEEEKEAEKLKKKPRCFRCGMQHDGPCPPG